MTARTSATGTERLPHTPHALSSSVRHPSDVGGRVRNALLAAWSADHPQLEDWPHVTDAQLRVTQLLRGEPVPFFGRDLPDGLRAELHLRADGYYTADAHDRVRTRTDYP